MGVSTAAVAGSAALVLALLAPAPVVAQVAPADELPQGITIGGRARLVYDDNILRVRDGVQEVDGRQTDDLVGVIAGIASLNITPGMQRIRATAEVGREYHTNNLFLDRTRLSAGLDWDWKATPRCSGKALSRYSKAQADLAEQGLIAANARTIFDVSMGGGCEVAPGLRPTLTVQHREGSNSSFSRRASNFNTEAIEGGVSYNRTGRLGVALNYRDERFTYPNRIRPEDGSVTEVRRRLVRGQVGGTVAERIFYTATVDYNWVDPTGAGEGFDGFSGGLDVTVRPMPRYRIQLQALRSIEPALFVSAGYVLQDRLELGTVYTISPRTSLNLRGGVLRNRYRDLQPVNLADIRTFDRLLFVAAGASYDIAPNIRLDSEVRSDERRTDGAFGTYQGTRAVATLSLAI
ncbi:hypothetical protein ACH0CP_13735 [Sphingomonas sp. 179-I 2A4 NHS]|uniref:hypothetical protein n=1 Tax=unclassified Sphingomonas TaxID=196159 RepID=UPI00387A6CEE